MSGIIHASNQPHKKKLNAIEIKGKYQVLWIGSEARRSAPRPCTG